MRVQVALRVSLMFVGRQLSHTIPRGASPQNAPSTTLTSLTTPLERWSRSCTPKTTASSRPAGLYPSATMPRLLIDRPVPAPVLALHRCCRCRLLWSYIYTSCLHTLAFIFTPVVASYSCLSWLHIHACCGFIFTVFVVAYISSRPRGFIFIVHLVSFLSSSAFSAHKAPH